jgi:hypothetical protein
MVNRIADEVAIAVDVGFWGDSELEVKATLLRFGPGVHPHLHDAFGDRFGIPEAS